jgi:hypothetical protein
MSGRYPGKKDNSWMFSLDLNITMNKDSKYNDQKEEKAMIHNTLQRNINIEAKKAHVLRKVAKSCSTIGIDLLLL